MWNQGEVRLASMPAAEETRAAMPMRMGDSPFIDLSSLVRYGLRGLVSVVFHPRMDGRLFTTSKSDDDCCRAIVEASAGWCAILVVKELSRENMVSCMYIVVVNYYSTLLVVFIRIFL